MSDATPDVVLPVKHADIDRTLDLLSYAVLLALVLFQYIHYVGGTWQLMSHPYHRGRIPLTVLIAVFWALYGIFALSVTSVQDKFPHTAPFLLLALTSAPLLTLLTLSVSPSFRRFADRLSLPWLVSTFSSPSRRTTGILLLFYYFAGRLPPLLAWVAGPGEWLSGAAAEYAVSALTPFRENARMVLGVSARHWSAADYKDAVDRVRGGGVDGGDRREMRRGVAVAEWMVGVGIAVYVVEVAVMVVAVVVGARVEEVARMPLLLVAAVLAPQVLVAEVLAMRQLWVLGGSFGEGEVEKGDEEATLIFRVSKNGTFYQSVVGL